MHRSASAPPNLILIVLDTTRADRMSFNGYSHATTPNIDAFARDGVIYSNAHSVAPWTLPSHMSMFTGELPGQHGATWPAFSSPEDKPLSELLKQSFQFSEPSRFLPQRLRTLGYSTVGFSSNAWVSKRTGFDLGFDAFYEMWNEKDPLDLVYRWLPPLIRTSKHMPSEVGVFSGMDAGDAGKVLRRLRRHVLENGELQEPFFLFFNFIDPHYPYSPPLPWRYLYSDDETLGEAIAHFEFNEMSMEAGDPTVDVRRFSPFYDAEISYVDFMLGHLFEWLHRKGYYDESLIIVTADHGEQLGEGGRFSHQFSIGEELLAVPLVVKYPGNQPHGSVVENPLVSNLDVYATLLAAATPGWPLAGEDTPSQNLRAMSHFERSFLIAEYFYSRAYLEASQRAWPGFSIEENAVNRRVVYEGRKRYTFVERNGKLLDSPEPSAAADIAGRARALAQLRRYLAQKKAFRMRRMGDAPDTKTLERLRALGYVD